MKNLFKLDIKTLAIILLVIIIILLKMCRGTDTHTKTVEIIKVDGKKYEVVKHDTVKNSRPIVTIINRPQKDIHHDTIIYVTVAGVPDTSYIIKNYYAKNVYSDTLVLNDSVGYVAIKDTISQNNIVGRTYNSKVKERIVKETITIKEPPRRQLFGGFNIGLDQKVLTKSLGVSSIYKDKKNNLYQVGIGVNNNVNGSSNELEPYIFGGLLWKLGKKQ